MSGTITSTIRSGFIEARFPTNISYGAVGGCDWSTRTVKLDSGWDYRRAYYPLDRGRWTVTHKFRSASEWAQLISLFRNTSGRLVGFRFQDPTDYTHETYLGSGVSAGVVMTNPLGQLQFYKSYTLTDVMNNPQVVYRPIFKPAPDQPVTITDPSGHTTRSGWTLDATTGVVAGGGVLANDVWYGQFDVPVRFDTDRMELTYEFFNAQAEAGGASWLNLPLVEIVEPLFPTSTGNLASAPGSRSMVKGSGRLDTRWHLNSWVGGSGPTGTIGAFGSGAGGGSNNINSVSLTINSGPSTHVQGGYGEPDTTKDIWIFAAVYEARSNYSLIGSVVDSLGNAYQRRSTTTLFVPNVVGGITANVPLNLDVWYFSSLPSPQSSLGITANFSHPVDSVVAAVLALGDSSNLGSPFETASPFISTGTVAANTTTTPSIGGITTYTKLPVTISIIGSIQMPNGTEGNYYPATYGIDTTDFVDGTGGNFSNLLQSHSGISGFQVSLGCVFTQSHTFNNTTLTMAGTVGNTTSESGWIWYVDVLGK